MSIKIKVDGVVLPNKPLINFELLSVANKLRIPNFVGYFDEISYRKKSLMRERGILNVDDSLGYGSHWTAWFKNNNEKYYFSSFGTQLPLEL